MDSDVMEMLRLFLQRERERVGEWLSDGGAQDFVEYKAECARIEALKDVEEELKNIEQKILES